MLRLLPGTPFSSRRGAHRNGRRFRAGRRRAGTAEHVPISKSEHSGRSLVRFLRCGLPKGGDRMYSILYIIGAIVVLIVLLRLLGVY
jgi:hypothetical protein